MTTKTMITLRLFHIAVEDDGDGDDGNDDGIDNTKNNSKDNKGRVPIIKMEIFNGICH